MGIANKVGIQRKYTSSIDCNGRVHLTQPERFKKNTFTNAV